MSDVTGKQNTRSKIAHQKKTQEKAETKRGFTLPRPSSPLKANVNVSGKKEDRMNNEEVLRELREMRKENMDNHIATTTSLSNIEASMASLKAQMDGLEKRMAEAESRISTTEDTTQRQHRVLRHLMRREVALTNVCDDLQNRMRRNNLRIYQVPEDSEKGNENMTAFVKRLITTGLPNLPPEMDIRIERAHRSLGLKTVPPAAPRSIIVRFHDYTVKETVLREAWSQKEVKCKDNVIYFDQDYSPEVQAKRAKVRAVIKQLKEKGIKAKCRFPAQLRVNLTSGEKTFPTLIEALPTLERLGVEVQVNERDKMERELHLETWQQDRRRRGRGGETISNADLQSYI